MWNREGYTQMQPQLAAPVGLECSLQIIKFTKKIDEHHRALLVRWLLHKYKYLWDVEGNDRSLSL